MRRVDKIETATEPRFQEHFVGAMGIPHATDPYPRLAPARRSYPSARPTADRPTPPQFPREEHRMSDTQARGRRTGGREGRRAARLAEVAEKVPFITRQLQPVEVLSEEGLATIEQNADTILGDGRDRVPRGARRARAAARTPAATSTASGSASRAGWRASWCRRPRRASSTSTRATPPTPCISVAMATVLAPAYGSPFVRDLDGGRRYGTIEDFRNFVKLAYSTPFLHHSGGTVCEPVDLPVNKRHYDMVYAHMKYSDKPFMGSVTHPLRARDTVDMARILFGADALEERTVHPQPDATRTARSCGTRSCSARRRPTPRRTRP